MSNSTSSKPIVSFTISTHNRRDVLGSTLERLKTCGLDEHNFEVLVVDNASTDGTVEMLRTDFPQVQCFALKQNLGSCGKNVAIERARGQYIVFLDDDSYPLAGSISRMIQHFERDPHLGAAVFTIHLPDGSRECSAYPDVFIGCGTGFRRQALAQAGLLPADFFMQAEEYDLSLRLLDAGWVIQTFDDLHIQHLKSPTARRAWRTMRLDVRNNFIVAAKYFPDSWAAQFLKDWMKRYYLIATAKGQRTAFFTGLAQGIAQMLPPTHRHPIGLAIFEEFARLHQIERALASLNARSLLFIDYGKNILPYWLAAKQLGIKVVAIADSRLAGSGRYRGIPILSDHAARELHFDAAIISNSSTVHAQTRAEQWRRLTPRPVIDLLDESHLPALCPVPLLAA